MQRVAITTLALVLVGLTFTSKVHAQYGIWRKFKTDYERNKYWPEPFINWDRQAARAPFAIMVDKGWQLQNTVGDFHFDKETNQLTSAGEHKVRWIVHESLIQRRTVFVQRGANPDETATRIDAVQRYIAGSLIEGPLPEVLATNNSPPGTPADVTDRVFRGRDSSQPVPVLPAQSSVSGK